MNQTQIPSHEATRAIGALIYRKWGSRGEAAYGGPEHRAQRGEEKGGCYQCLHLWRGAQDKMRDTPFINLHLPPVVLCVCCVMADTSWPCVESRCECRDVAARGASESTFPLGIKRDHSILRLEPNKQQRSQHNEWLMNVWMKHSFHAHQQAHPVRSAFVLPRQDNFHRLLCYLQPFLRRVYKSMKTVFVLSICLLETQSTTEWYIFRADDVLCPQKQPKNSFKRFLLAVAISNSLESCTEMSSSFTRTWFTWYSCTSFCVILLTNQATGQKFQHLSSWAIASLHYVRFMRPPAYIQFHKPVTTLCLWLSLFLLTCHVWIYCSWSLSRAVAEQQLQQK